MAQDLEDRELKLGLTADLHGYLPSKGDIPSCDLLVIAGDICPVWDHRNQFSSMWLENDFSSWLDSLPMPVVGIAGNHDFIAQENPTLMERLPWVYLADQAWEYGGLNFYGSPWSGQFGNWAFMASEDGLQAKYDDIPEDTEVLIAHGPPYGHGDLVNNDWSPEPNVGSPSLFRRIETLEIPLTVTGHIHEAYGEYTTRRGKCKIINASRVTETYQPLNAIKVVEL